MEELASHQIDIKTLYSFKLNKGVVALDNDIHGDHVHDVGLDCVSYTWDLIQEVCIGSHRGSERLYDFTALKEQQGFKETVYSSFTELPFTLTSNVVDNSRYSIERDGQNACNTQ